MDQQRVIGLPIRDCDQCLIQIRRRRVDRHVRIAGADGASVLNKSSDEINATGTRTVVTIEINFNDVEHADGDVLHVGQAARIGDRDLNLVVVVAVVVAGSLEVRSCLECQHSGIDDDREQRVVDTRTDASARQAVGQASGTLDRAILVARLHVCHRRFILCHKWRRAADDHRGIVHVGYRNRQILRARLQSRIGHRDRDVVDIVRARVAGKFEVRSRVECQHARVCIDRKQRIVHCTCQAVGQSTPVFGFSAWI